MRAVSDVTGESSRIRRYGIAGVSKNSRSELRRRCRELHGEMRNTTASRTLVLRVVLTTARGSALNPHPSFVGKSILRVPHACDDGPTAPWGFFLQWLPSLAEVRLRHFIVPMDIGQLKVVLFLLSPTNEPSTTSGHDLKNIGRQTSTTQSNLNT
jgi:hypothetical protein